MKSRIGLFQGSDSLPKAIEQIYDSPFDYKRNALLGVPTNIPLPESPQFLQSIKSSIVPLIDACQGNAFVLFTSYGMLKSCYDALKDTLTNKGYHILRQGEDSRNVLVRKFKEKNRSVLFGTDSFWEGIDIVGDALRCVIITKLPFHVPTEPLFEARCEALLKHGKNPFMEYTVPRAVVKFKQAFGRLIRHKNDRGSVICLDTRLIRKNYGKLFLKSLPECTEIFEPLENLSEKMRFFYQRKN
jgi:ATP-dependent DNA helicase DinG